MSRPFGWRGGTQRLHGSFGLPAKNLLEYFPRLEELADKVVYGSDWLATQICGATDAIRALPISEQANKHSYGNAARLLNLGVIAERYYARQS